MSFDTPTSPFNASDPHARYLNASCLDFLLIEVVPMAERLVHELELAGGRPSSSSGETGGAKDGGAEVKDGTGTGIGIGSGSTVTKPEDDDVREATFYRLETLGFRVGQGLAERYVWGDDDDCYGY